MKQYVCTISISPERKKKYDLAKLKESWSQKMNLTDDNLYLNKKEKNSSCNGYYYYKMDFNDKNIVHKYSCN